MFFHELQLRLFGGLLQQSAQFAQAIRAVAGCLLAPYAAWVAFAGVLNLALWRLN